MTNREYLNSLSDDDFAEWLCKQLWDGFELGSRFIDIMRFNEVRNFLKGEYKEEPE